MTRKASIQARLQKEIDHVGTGILLLVELINYDELNILMKDVNASIDKFQLIVNKACDNFDKCKILGLPNFPDIYIVLPDDSRLAEKLAHLIYSEIQLHIDAQFPEAYLKCSIGSIKFFPEQNLKAAKLESMLMYGASCCQCHGYYYSYDDNNINIDNIKKRNSDLNLLKSSLMKKRVKFVYQPIIDRVSGNTEYYECLLRIIDENNNLISVGSMIEDAEKNGLINIIDFAVMKMAISELVKDPEIKLSVNISNIGVLNKRLLRKIENSLKKHSVADRLIIEITETSLNNNFTATKQFIDRLHQYGCQFSLDDFGSGFTSFKQLLNLPIDIIKIDGTYIRDILTNPHSKFFVKALISLAADLGIKTVAEFVENGEIAKCLTDIKIGGMQGDFFLPASEVRSI